MTDVMMADPPASKQPMIPAERLAWGIVLIFFSVFCALVVSSLLGVYYFLFQSTTPMHTLVQVSRGTAVVTGSNTGPFPVSHSQAIEAGTHVSTDVGAPAQTTVIFRDPGVEDRLLAVMTLKDNASMRVASTLRPRFEWSAPNYIIDVEAVSGWIDIFVADDLPRDIFISMNTVQGGKLLLQGSGRYTLEAISDHVELTNRDGEVVLVGPESSIGRSVPVGHTGSIHIGTDDAVRLKPALTNLVFNSDLLTPEDSGDGVGVVVSGGVPISRTRDASWNETMPIGWVCQNAPSNRFPRGSYRAAVSPDGRESLRLVRENADNNAFTACKQTFSGDRLIGVDVSDYDYLAAQATVYIANESVSLCGEKGSECSLMIRLGYTHSEGQVIQDQPLHGVYTRLDPAFDWYPRRCASCDQDHILVRQGAWYTFDSGNLMQLLRVPPESILNIEFRAEGHNYDVYIDEVSLVAGHLENSPADDDSRVAETE